jgi:hypothetical protein
MAVTGQYLRIVLDGLDFLLPSGASIAIEQRHSLIEGNGSEPAVAWWETQGNRCPAYRLDHDLRLTRDDNWQRAVYINARPHAVGLAANEIQMMPRSDYTVETFHPPGKPHSAHGHLFSAAWVNGNEVLLVLDPQALAGYLLGLGNGR